MRSKKSGNKQEPLNAIAESLDRITKWRHNQGLPDVSGIDAIRVVECDVIDSIRQALLGNYWHGPRDWRNYPPNPELTLAAQNAAKKGNEP